MEDDKLVEAIEEGQIVKVPEFYAKSEGLPIIKKPQATKLQEIQTQLPPSTIEREKRLLKVSQEHSNWKDRQVISELLENFHWLIRVERRKKGLTRKQFARIIDESEENIKLLESGILPKKDFILINKVQKALGINLRKDQKDFTTELKPAITKEMLKKRKEKNPATEQAIIGDDIEILDEEI